MITSKTLLRTGFHKIWRPHDGTFDGVTTKQYAKTNHVITVMHLHEALQCIQSDMFEFKRYNSFSLLDDMNINVISFFFTSCETFPDREMFTIEQGHDPTIYGSVQFRYNIKHILQEMQNEKQYLYVVEVLDHDKYSVVRILLSFKQYGHFPEINLTVLGFPIYLHKNQYYFLQLHENYDGNIVNHVVELLIEEDSFEKIEYWDYLNISTIKHEGDKRFRCKLVLDGVLKVCCSLSEEDTLVGLIASMLFRGSLRLFSAFENPVRNRLFAIDKSMRAQFSDQSMDDDSQMSISDIENECDTSEIDHGTVPGRDTARYAFCDYIVHAFNSGQCTIDLLALKASLMKNDIGILFPSKTEVNACLILLLQCVDNSLFLADANSIRETLLNLIPCEQLLTLKCKYLSACSDVMCPHDNYNTCPDVERTCYTYILFSVRRWLKEIDEIT